MNEIIKIVAQFWAHITLLRGVMFLLGATTILTLWTAVAAGKRADHILRSIKM